MGDWENHEDPAIRAEGEKKLYESYNTIRIPLAYKYIELIKGLDAFSKSKNYGNIIDENCSKISLSQATLESTMQEIEANAAFYKNNSQYDVKEIKRFDIIDATEILLACFKQLGENYHKQAIQLFDPHNGRLDIIGGENRMGMQGVASVYPIDVSIFFANNYLGYYIDLILLSHEAGHAIQASLMHENKVSLLNASGPGYFTESFGKFNELLASHYLYETAKNNSEKKYYSSKYLDRLLNLFGSTTEAAVEYNLVKGIITNEITRPSDLDSITFLVGNKYRDFTNSPEQKGLWMRMETNFKAPLHNMNDMMASLLAIKYFQQFLKDKNSFSIKFEKFLKNGYTDTPSNLLNKFMSININEKNFCKDAIDFIKSEVSFHISERN